jgi:ectoine hydroxylase-related dioxygenase (phytanoyl-CoA dioxygenase family)
MSALETVSSNIDPKRLADILNRDGAAIVEQALVPNQLSRLNAELDEAVSSTAPGLRRPTHESMVEFYGTRTIRFDGLPARSRTFQEVMLLPFMVGVADELLLSNCEDYLLNTAQLIQIGSGESLQSLHRDEDAWPFVQPPKPQLEVEAMFALSDFTAANGATRVVPGSHTWPADRQALEEEITQAEMVAGSALVYLGSTLHGGGANRSADESRRGMFLGYVVGWLRTEENTYLTVPIDYVKTMPQRVQELLGYKAHGAIGVVDVGSPMVLLES